jgi:nucleoside-diphosphate-sugar epimerase
LNILSSILSIFHLNLNGYLEGSQVQNILKGDIQMKGTVTILGINGRIGQFAAKAFIDEGWRVTGFGRENRAPFDGFEFRQGDGFKLEDVARAVEGADVVVHALNLPYDKWAKDAERLNRVVIEALKGSQKTMIFAANIYNYLASDHQLSSTLRQKPQTAKGAIRYRMEEDLKRAAREGNFQFLSVRAGDYFGPEAVGSWFDLGLATHIKKSKLSLPCDGVTKHSWAYLPDVGRVFERIADKRNELDQLENFHFSGHFVTGNELAAAVQKVVPSKLKISRIPWWLFSVLGLFQPIMREILEMRYLWQNPHQLIDDRLDAILGENFGTPFERAIAETVLPMLDDAPQSQVIGRAKAA